MGLYSPLTLQDAKAVTALSRKGAETTTKVISAGAGAGSSSLILYYQDVSSRKDKKKAL